MDNGISFFIVNYGTPRLVTNFLVSIEKNIKRKENFEIIIIDNNYPYKGDLRKVIMPTNFSFRIQFVQNPKTSYASAINLAAQFANYNILIIANSDIEILPQFSYDYILNIFRQNERIGVIGPQLVNPDGSWQRSYGPFPSLLELIFSLCSLDALSHALQKCLMSKKLLPKIRRQVHYVDGAFMMIRRKCFDECNGMNENYDFYAEDIDICWRARKLGWKVVFSPSIHITHLRGASSTQKSFINYTVRQFKAKFQFMKEHRNIRQAQHYKKLIEVIALQRFFFYSIISSFMPLNKHILRKRQAYLNYIAARNYARAP